MTTPAINLNDLTPGTATHPGEILADQLQARSITQQDFANSIGMKKSQLNEIIKGKRDINAEVALLMARSLGMEDGFWIAIQRDYDLAKAKIQAKYQKRLAALDIWNRIKESVAVPFFKKQGVLSGDPLEDLPILKKIYQLASFDELVAQFGRPALARFRKSTSHHQDPVQILGWFKYVQYCADQEQVGSFDCASKDQVISKLRRAIYDNTNLTATVRDILNREGIKIIYQDKVGQVPVDGVAFWSSGNPAIGLTRRHKRIDNFAFTLFHELGHIYLHLSGDTKAEFIDLEKEENDYKNSEQEKEANEFASNYLIPPIEWNAYFQDSDATTDTHIIRFAKRILMHPAVIRGRCCHELGTYRGHTDIDYHFQ